LCNYNEYLSENKREKSHVLAPSVEDESLDSENAMSSEKTGKQKTVTLNPKLTFKERLEFETIDSEIEVLEQELDKIAKGIAESGSDYTMLQELQEKNETIEIELLAKLERQEYLEEKDKLSRQ
jgi:ATP-binding cassette subfamily F protein uup